MRSLTILTISDTAALAIGVIHGVMHTDTIVTSSSIIYISIWISPKKR